MDYLELTDRDSIKTRAGVERADWNDFIATLANHVSTQIQNRLKRYLKKQEFIERFTPRPYQQRLYLAQGPINLNQAIPQEPDVKVEYLEEIDDSDDEVWTELVYKRHYTADNLSSEATISTGRIIFRPESMFEAIWTYPLGLRVTYKAGWEITGTAPKVWPPPVLDLHDFATRWGAHLFKTREVYGLQSKDLGEGTINPTAQTEFEEAIDKELMHWRTGGWLVA